jgi:hypothetical protein
MSLSLEFGTLLFLSYLSIGGCSPIITHIRMTCPSLTLRMK